MAFNERDWQGLQKRYRLTPRELEIAILVCEGLDNDEIAKKLEISYNTVRAHLQNIYRRVGTRNKITLVLRFVDNVSENFLKKMVEMTNANDYERPITIMAMAARFSACERVKSETFDLEKQGFSSEICSLLLSGLTKAKRSDKRWLGGAVFFYVYLNSRRFSLNFFKSFFSLQNTFQTSISRNCCESIFGQQ